jgi:hypothetical protein
MSEAQQGDRVTVLRVTEEAEEDARLLTFLEENEIRPGSVFDVVDVADHIGTMTLRRDGREVTVGLVAAAKLRVLPGEADRALFHEVPERARLAAAAR